ncbi:unnamed protein product [Calicophoron daubneyi]|uniref:Ionotropic glutamate receptor C-terminal domain-containing protein n=1 Tax=Calicophoron daubneyi TaxID=300641 RepID=A0AAV2TK49_CALDB
MQLGFLCFGCLLLLSARAPDASGSPGPQWTIHTPRVAPYAIKDPVSGQTYGIIQDLFHDWLETRNGKLSVSTVPDWFEHPELRDEGSDFDNGAVKCYEKISEDQLDSPTSQACLFQGTSAAFTLLDKTTNHSPIITVPWITLKPVILSACSPGSCPRQIFSPSIRKGMYFLLPFHSSTWSFILLYALVTGSLIFLFERTHRFRCGTSYEYRTGERAGDHFSLGDSYIWTFMGLLLHSYRKLPRSWASLTLSLFWNAFCLVCVTAYAIGTYAVLFHNEDELNQPLILSPNSTIACDSGTPWCTAMENQSNTLTLIKTTPIRDEHGYIVVHSLNSSIPFLTDHVTASQIETHSEQADINLTSIQWKMAAIRCPGTTNPIQLPTASVHLSTGSGRMAFWMNMHLQHLTETGKMSGIINRWIPSDLQPYSICQSTNSEDRVIPLSYDYICGPLLFMLIGGFVALIAHFAELFYNFCGKKKSFLITDDLGVTTEES